MTIGASRRVTWSVGMALLGSVGWVAAAGGGATRAETRPNVVIVLVDTLRADHTSLYGYGRKTTPHLERVAAEGLVLRNFFVNAPWTKPSVGSFFTGLHPSAHGSRVGQFEEIETGTPRIETLSSKLTTLAERLLEAGYSTNAFVTNCHMTPKFGYDQGFETYLFQPDGANREWVCAADRAAVQWTIDALKSARRRPVFVWCHLMAVHQYASPTRAEAFVGLGNTPIDRSAPMQERMARYERLEDAVADYDNAIAYDDYLIGKLFDYVSASRPNTILVVASDHGEEFYDHGGFSHGGTLYNELLRCPCVIWGPGAPTGEIAGLSSSVDLLPTILELVGMAPDPQLPGKALVRQGRPTQGKEEVFAEKHHNGSTRQYALIREGKKLIVSEEKSTGKETLELYDDGLGIETQPRAVSENREVADRLGARLEAHRARNAETFEREVGDAELELLSDEDLARIRALGYVR
jgi:choline-sulfatase